MSGSDLESRLVASLPELRGKLKAGAPLKDFTWFRAGGPAEVLYSPADEADLAYFMKGTPTDIPVTIIGLGSNLLVRDGGIEGVVIRLGRGFGEIAVEEGSRLRVGAAVPDVKVARAAADAGIAGLSFYRGIPGCVGGALRMNGGAHGRETREVVVEARAVDREGKVHVFQVAELHYEYRHCGVPDDLIFTEALFQGEPGEPAKILAEMDGIAAYREQAQPIKSRTGGSTFKNPPGKKKAWQLIDAAGCRGLAVGDAKVSEMHCNFLINEGNATGADIEKLGETVRARVKETSGVELEWEIKRLGVPR
ncbi:MAG TPA: UDP-N-acetylenolpyruvoylglucosamine reductase [Rhizobiales bacterium]|nr:UDP-N-acetylenolpyruvoylglucosamine reductase [Hyphomicrobiales bacterium]HBH40525.1 UDP-N-acetylenolpyruvoylglucosamine reductase [Hyphomicrobiales bacterium]HCL60936.1 UDP-N-acetylenolpyruvoylglucosamine reductase [Hyphomicrobiales bacterium]